MTEAQSFGRPTRSARGRVQTLIQFPPHPHTAQLREEKSFLDEGKKITGRAVGGKVSATAIPPARAPHAHTNSAHNQVRVWGLRERGVRRNGVPGMGKQVWRDAMGCDLRF